MSKFSIRTWNGGEFFGEFDKSLMSDTIWLSLPKKYFINMLGSMIYFECPLDCPIEGELVTQLDVGDIAYWPGANALCIFFGPTPLSKDDGRPVSPYPVIKLGHMLGDFSALEDAGDRQAIKVDRAF
ncbi:MAG: AfsR family transcriptional regulator [Thermoplasmata archaeon]|nr:AfsR family transcriptional regulator [Thermoplasmata archaeon]